MSKKEDANEVTEGLMTPKTALSTTSQPDYGSNETTPQPELRQPSQSQSQHFQHQYSLKHILPALWIGSFLAAMDGTVVANIMGGIAADFQQEDLKSWIATSYLLTNTAFQPLYGKVSDIIGRKYALMCAQFFFGLGCFLSIFATNVKEFAIARAICGMGGGGLGAMSSIVVSDIVTLEERGIFQGYANINFALGQTLGAPLGAILLTTIGWRWIFGIQVPSVMICMYLAYRHVNIGHERHLTKENISRIDFGGAITLVISITLFLLMLSTNLDKQILGIGFIISTIAFIYIESFIAREQILPAHLVKGILGICGFSSFAASFVLNATMFGIPSFLQIVQNQSSKASGGFLIFISISVSLGSLAAGHLLRTIKADIKSLSLWISAISVIIVLLGISIIFTILKTLEPYHPGFNWKLIMVSGLTILGFGYGAYLVSLLITVVAICGKEGQAAATGMNYLFRSIGQVLGVGISLAIYDKSILQSLNQILLQSDEKHGEEIMENLLRDTNYLKTSTLIPQKLLFKLLEAYKGAMVSSFYPGMILAIMSVFISGGIAVKYGRNKPVDNNHV